MLIFETVVDYLHFRLEKFDGTIPFDFLTWVDLGNCCSYSSKQMGEHVFLVLS